MSKNTLRIPPVRIPSVDWSLMQGDPKAIEAYFACDPSCSVTITFPPVEPCGCGAPNGAWTSDITGDYAVIHWFERLNADLYKVRYKEVGSSDPWTTLQTINTYKSISGLTPQYRI